ncbi:hypothetical protein SAMN04488548_1098 [Gordonia westfalica]|uniref:Uncharacterized protein n=1 Tax=Gordonia westfalica TaxID=158898 RepID=A0A1H2DNI5_9ACTN|nr:hypothetical protein SAMN04488548_1098 [Gordonia westfalica]
MSDADEKAVAEALYAVESVHHFHGTECLCGFNSHRARERTAHITRLALGSCWATTSSERRHSMSDIGFGPVGDPRSSTAATAM